MQITRDFTGCDSLRVNSPPKGWILLWKESTSTIKMPWPIGWLLATTDARSVTVPLLTGICSAVFVGPYFRLDAKVVYNKGKEDR